MGVNRPLSPSPLFSSASLGGQRGEGLKGDVTKLGSSYPIVARFMPLAEFLDEFVQFFL